MEMRNIFVVALLLNFIVGVLKVKAAVFYIAPDPINNQSCADTSQRFSPCYSLRQLNGTLLSNKIDTTVTLFFFSGKHILAGYHEISVSNTSQLVLLPYPWNRQKVEVECRVPALLGFQDVWDLTVFSITFTACTLKLASTKTPSFGPTFVVTDCIFASKGLSYSIIAPYVDVTITRCTFHSNHGAVYSNNTFTSRNKFYVNIENTTFSNSTRNGGRGGAVVVKHVQLTVSGCHFIENTATSGGAIYSEFSVIQIENTTFVGNLAQDSGGAVYSLHTKCYLNPGLN